MRLVAATNRDLRAMVADKEFRSDLYYRLNVFPIVSPPLRERREDIPRLVRYFAQKFARRMNKRIETIPTETMAALSRYHWPGNIRELENVIERAVILSRGSNLEAPLAELQTASKPTRPGRRQTAAPTTLEEAEREHIRARARAGQLDRRRAAGAAAQLGHEAHDAAVEDEQARDQKDYISDLARTVSRGSSVEDRREIPPSAKLDRYSPPPPCLKMPCGVAGDITTTLALLSPTSPAPGAAASCTAS